MATVNFLFRSKKDKAPLNIRLLFRHDNKDYVIGGRTKYFVKKDYWENIHFSKSNDIDDVNKRAKVNKKLSKIQSHILKSFYKGSIEDINKEWLSYQLELYHNPIVKESHSNNLLKCFELIVKSKENDIKESSIQKYEVVKKMVERYEKNIVKKPILIKDVNLSFKNGFEGFCTNNHYSKNTVARALKTIKTVCNDAKFNGVEVSHQLIGIKPKVEKIKSIYLNFSELKNIENKELIGHLDNARDWLIISCYTGQRVSDFMRFTKEMIRYQKDNDGVLKPLIEFTQVKTDKIMTVPVHQKVIEILNKRNGEFPHSISEQKYNDYIKEVCAKAKINKMVKGKRMAKVETKSKFNYRKKEGTFEKHELVTSHIGRRSFATNFYGTIPTSYLKNITGHSTESMFLKYIGKSNKDTAIDTHKYF